jgi:hypothetical protein
MSSKTPGRISLNPIVDVTVLRVRYVATLAAALVAGFTIVESFAFGGSARRWIGFALGAGIALGAAAGLVASLVRDGEKQHVHTAAGLRIPLWDTLAAAAMAIGAWQVVQTLVFPSAWLTFANGCALAALALIGLVVHELSTERVVHALEVVGSAVDGESREADGRARVAAG